MTCPRRPGTFFTYATPHNGIDFGIFGLHIPVPQIAPFDAQIFSDGAEHVWAAWEVNIGQVTSVPDPITPAWLTPTHPAACPSPSPCPRPGSSSSASTPP